MPLRSKARDEQGQREAMQRLMRAMETHGAEGHPPVPETPAFRADGSVIIGVYAVVSVHGDVHQSGLYPELLEAAEHASNLNRMYPKSPHYPWSVYHGRLKLKETGV